jgi:hypothetical protein
VLRDDFSERINRVIRGFAVFTDTGRIPENKGFRTYDARAPFFLNRAADSLVSTEHNRNPIREDLRNKLVVKRIMCYRHDKSISSVHLAKSDETFT